MKTVAVIDLSWEMYRGRHALKDLSYKIMRADGSFAEYPVGHVYNTCEDIHALSCAYDVVILVVDSIRKERKEVQSAYKAGRHEKTGDPFIDYNIFNDLKNILQLCTYLPNVVYAKLDDYEADDIIAMFIARTKTEAGKNMCLSAYFSDNDILATPGEYNWHTHVAGRNALDRRDYLMKKYGLPLLNLPICYKIVRGDPSDKIPSAVVRFPSALLVQACVDLAEVFDFDIIYQYFLDSLEDKTNMKLNKLWKERLSELKDKESSMYKALWTNYQVVCPALPKYEDVNFKKLKSSPGEIQSLFQHYQITTLYEKWGLEPTQIGHV